MLGCLLDLLLSKPSQDHSTHNATQLHLHTHDSLAIYFKFAPWIWVCRADTQLHLVLGLGLARSRSHLALFPLVRSSLPWTSFKRNNETPFEASPTYP
ncbi:uncharacterized protein L3040_007195 [Drepanopeziza brunnea f. sp. 'multigermtubi']|uniref:uncharacterized protein n=1 Tax=Drepanopeziza brunnea f. sp. 'multigermtubi' TaxID=698441 RepID=UPI00239459AD|nr:hypothetical protein L3040_007195 [Drepanopeziza brunnea f. sp. 'multigermtubi']